MSFVRSRRCQAWLLCFILAPGFSGVYALDLNQATRAQLRAIKGVGDKLAERILAARQQGRFVSMEDLAARVAGVGPKTIQSLRAQGVRTDSFTADPAPLAASPQSHSAHTAGSGLKGSDLNKRPSVRRPKATRNGTADDRQHAGHGQGAGHSIPAMPLLIQPRPRAVAEPAKTQPGSAGTAAADKTH